MKIITRRIGTVIEFGNSLGLTLREELLDLGLVAKGDVIVMVTQNQAGDKRIVIRPARIEKKK